MAKRQALARRGIARYAPSGKGQILVRDLMMRALALPGVSHAFAATLKQTRK